jgi:hypothetical protein
LSIPRSHRKSVGYLPKAYDIHRDFRGGLAGLEKASNLVLEYARRHPT